MKNAASTYKDIFTIPYSVILHIGNVDGGFGSGFAGQIARRYPKVKAQYKDWYSNKHLKLGQCMYSELDEDTERYLVTLLAMPTYRKISSKQKCFLDYEALDKALDCFKTTWCYDYHLDDHPWGFEKRTILIPCGMGAGNAGGDWDKVTYLLDKHLPFYVVCKLPKHDEN